jgi:Zn-dependent protease/predicted transcriptional regulator
MGLSSSLMKWSLKLGSVAGIGVYLHWTFVLLIGWIFLAHLGAGETPREALAGVGFILALFGCVVLHEFGHALTAKRYGVETRDITLLPIGGVARLERIPEKPAQEFWVAIAGPAVNAVIAATIYGVLLIQGRTPELMNVQGMTGGFLPQLMWVNLFIGTFNLLPAFPMDGGRILRALLASRMGRPRATAIAANIGQIMAILLGVLGFFYNPFLIFIAVFVYLGAQGEAAQVEAESALQGLQVRDAMMTRFRTLSAHDTLGTAVEELLAGSQQDFPVLENGQVLGVLRRNDLVKALMDGNRGAAVADVMWRDCTPVNDTDVLTPTLESMGKNEWTTLPVMGGGRIVGLLTLENIGELIMVNAALTGKAARVSHAG